jgi:O-methyltransferase
MYRQISRLKLVIVHPRQFTRKCIDKFPDCQLRRFLKRIYLFFKNGNLYKGKDEVEYNKILETYKYNLSVLKNNFRNLSQAYEYLFNKYFNEIKSNNKRTELLERLLGTQIPEAYFIVSLLGKTKDISGDICEFGVAQGETSALIANEIEKTNKKLHLFDSFEGLPDPTEKDKLKDDIFNLGSMEAYRGEMKCSEDMVRERLKSINFSEDKYIIHRGFIENLIKDKNNFPKKVSFAYVDFDFYEPTKMTLEYLDTITDKGAIIMIDDYDWFSMGIKTAVDEFVAEKNKSFKEYDFYVPNKIFGCFATLTKV